MRLSRVDIRKILHIQFKLRVTPSQAARNINTCYGRGTTTRGTCYNWFKKFRLGASKVEDNKRSGRPLTVNPRAVLGAVENKPTATIRELASGLGTSKSTIQRRLKKLGKKRKLGEFVPHELTEVNKMNRLSACRILLARHRRMSFFKRLVTCDESWVWYDGSMRKPQWLSPQQQPEPSPRRNMHGKKVLLCIWWAWFGPVHWELLANGLTINERTYCDMLDRVQTALQFFRGAGHIRGRPVFQQDNARPHVSRFTRNHILENLGWETIVHPPYSPDLAPSDYHLFRSLKNYLRDRRFQNRADVENEVATFLGSQPMEFYYRGLKNLAKRWQIVIDKNGEYIVKNDLI